MKQSLEERLRQHPHLHARISQLLDVVENAAGDVEKADEAERRVIAQLRRLGQEALQGWAEHQQGAVQAQAEANPGLQRKEKKGSTGTPASGRSQ
jgi:hypothetical protein